jgi:hypothetical protein
MASKKTIKVVGKFFCGHRHPKQGAAILVPEAAYGR